MDSIENLFRTVDIKDQLPVIKSVIDEASATHNLNKLTSIINRLLRDDVPPQVAFLPFLCRLHFYSYPI